MLHPGNGGPRGHGHSSLGSDTENIYLLFIPNRNEAEAGIFCIFALFHITSLKLLSPPSTGTMEDANFILIPDVKSVLSDLSDSWGMCKDL